MRSTIIAALAFLSCTKRPTPEVAPEASASAEPKLWCASLIEARPGVTVGTAHVKLSGDRVLDEPAAPAICTTSDAQHWLVPKNGVVFAACTRDGLIEVAMTDRTPGHVDFTKPEWQGSNIVFDLGGAQTDRPHGQQTFSFIDDPTKSVDLGTNHTKVRSTFAGATPLLIEVEWTCPFTP